MADVVDRRYPSGSSTGFDARYEKEHRHDGGTSYGTGARYNSRSTDYDNAVVPYNPGVYRTYDLRTQYGSGEHRRLEVVKGNIFSVNQIYVTPPREAPPYRPPLALPEPKDDMNKARTTTWFNDPEMKRKRRVASYKAYSVEGKVKASLKKGFRWIRYKCSELIHGW